MSRVVAPRLFADLGLVAAQKVLVAAKAASVELALEAPRGEVLELQVGEKVVRHTNAILLYVGRIYETSDLCGSSFIETAQVDGWLEWCEVELGYASPPAAAAAIEALERHLENRVYLVGQRFTLADISIACTVRALSAQGAGPLPTATKRWLATCESQDCFQSVFGGAGAAAGSSAASASKAASGGASFINEYSSCVGGRTHIGHILLSPDGGKSLIGKLVSVCGWVKTKREANKGQLMFVELNDGSCVSGLQCVIDAACKGFEDLKEGCNTGASLRCTGELVASPGQGQAVELQLVKEGHEVKMFGSVPAKDYPLAKKHHSMEYLRSIAHLRPRSNFIGCVARIRSALAFATHEFFRTNGFLYVHTPLITAADCEGAGEMFQVTTLMAEAEEAGKSLPRNAQKQIDYTKDFFGKKAFLTVSGQLSVENYCCALSNVYTFGPTFRAENSHTSRHLAEFWMIEPELAFADITDDMNCAEDYLKHCIRFVMENHRDDLLFFQDKNEKGLIARLENLLKEPFARVTYTEAIEILIAESPKADFKVPVEWGIDLGSEHERYLTEKVMKKPTIVYNYPKDIKAFYMRLNEDDKTVAAMDVLAPAIGEVIGGSQREERLDVLDRRISEMGLNIEDYWWYRDLRRYGSVPHAGFGLGFERLIMLATGVENIRDVIPYPRYPGHAEF